MWTRSTVDDLREAERFEALDTEFQAVAGLFGAAKGHPWVYSAVFVDPHRAGVDTRGDFTGGSRVRGPDRSG